MEHYDPKKTARVWQRVQSTGQIAPDTYDLPGLIAEEQSDAATYLYLSRKFTGRESAILRRMHTQELSHAACLKGIYALSAGEALAARATKPHQEPVEVTLRRCYGREMRCLSQYEARSSDPQHGHIFSRLAQQEREHCRILLEILGSLKPRR